MASYEEEKRIRAFVEDWTGHGYEKGECQKFWLDLLERVLGVDVPGNFIQFEEQAQLDHTSFIDARIPSTHTLIEQKSIGKSLTEPIKQSDGTRLTPAQQAQRYAATLPYSERRNMFSEYLESFGPENMRRALIEPFQVLEAKEEDSDLYMEDNFAAMPIELRRAHQANDRAVMKAYGFPTSAEQFSEADCVAALMNLYQEKVSAIGTAGGRV